MDDELEQLGERIAEQAAHLDAATHRLLADLRVFDERGGWRAQGALSCAHWLSWRVGWSLGTARDHVRVARKISEFPAIDDALRRGEVSYSKVRAMLRIATPANELLLLDYARLMTGSQLEETCRKYSLVLRHGQDPHPLGDLQRRYVRRRDTEDGMVKIEAVLHPEEAELVWTMLSHAATKLAHTPVSSSADVSAETPPSNAATSVSVAATTSETSADTGEPSEVECKAAPPAADSLIRQADVSAETRLVLARESRASMSSGRAAATTSEISAGSGEPPPVECKAAAPPAADSLIRQADVSAEIQQWLAARIAARASRFVDAATRTGSSRDAPGSTGYAQGGSTLAAHVAEVCESRQVPEPLQDETAMFGDAGGREGEARGRGGDGGERGGDGGDRGGDAREGIRTASPGGGRSILHQRDDATRRAFSRADALVSLAQDYLRGDRPNRAPIEVVLSIPASSLGAGGIDPVEVGEIGASYVSREAARRMSCDCGVVEVIEDEHGTPLSMGRKRRTFNGMLKRALVQRDKTCSFPGCTNHLFLEGHHIRHWADGGETSLLNAALLFSTHHHYVHEYGYTIELDQDQRPRFRDPHGRLVAAVPERPATAELGWPRIRAANEPLGIDADTIACEWDGSAVNYHAIVGHLVVADGLQ